MKKTVLLLLALVLAVSTSILPVSAQTYTDRANISVSKNNVVVGDEITVTITHNADYDMSSIEGGLYYNNSVLSYISSSEDTANKGEYVAIARTPSAKPTDTIVVKFKAIAAGSGSLLYNVKSYSADDDGVVNTSRELNVTAAKPSTNANLGSLKVSTGELTPAFKATTTNYTVTVRYPTDKITLRANAAMGDSKVEGAGTFTLKVGDNPQSITVTAAAGNKKTYNVTVKRLSEEETAAEELKDLENDPLFFKYNNEGRLLVEDLAGMSDFEGYTKSVFENKDKKISYFADNAGKYNLFWATDLEGGGGTFYNRLSSGEYQKVNYISDDKNIYIIEPFEEDINVSDKYAPSNIEINGEDVGCYKYNEAGADELYVFYCYANGENGYYVYDPDKGTVKPEPDFLAAEVVAAPEQSEGLLDKFNNLNNEAKIIVILLLVAALLVIALIILLIIKAAGGRKKPGDIDELSKEIDYAIVGYEAEKEPEEETPAMDPVGEELEMIISDPEPEEAPAPEEPGKDAQTSAPAEESIESEIESVDEFVIDDKEPEPETEVSPVPEEPEEPEEPEVDPLAPDTAIIDTSEFIDLEDDL